jgi:hypothetical protein
MVGALIESMEPPYVRLRSAHDKSAPGGCEGGQRRRLGFHQPADPCGRVARQQYARLKHASSSGRIYDDRGNRMSPMPRGIGVARVRDARFVGLILASC